MPTDLNELRKRAGLSDHLTRGELAARVNRDRSRLARAESAGHIPAPVRIGRMRIRLYSPEHVAKAERYFKRAKSGRPKGGGQ